MILFKEIITVYTENLTKPTNIKCSATECQKQVVYELPMIFKSVTESRRVELNICDRSLAPAVFSEKFQWFCRTLESF
jgi:hypothetical protein